MEKMKENWEKYKKKIAILVVIMAFVIWLIVMTVTIIQDREKTATVETYIAPSIAIVKIGGQEYGTMEEIKIKPGEYEVEIFAEGFVTQKKTIAAENDKTVTIRTYLEPEEWNIDYYEENAGDGLIAGEISADETYAALDDLIEKFPIINALPIEIDYYTADYVERVKYTISYDIAENYESFAIVIIDYTGGNYENALDKLRARGYEPEEYKIVYTDESEDGLGNAQEGV